MQKPKTHQMVFHIKILWQNAKN